MVNWQLALLALVPLMLVYTIGWFGVRIARRWVGGPQYPYSDARIQFDETWTTGCSHKSFLTRGAASRNCLRVTVTESELWVTAHFPFNILGPEIDMDHRVPLSTIASVVDNGKTVCVRFALPAGGHRTLEFRLRRPDEFVAALGMTVADELPPP